VGYYHDDAPGTFYIRARMYEPVTGRWMSRDPISAGFNLYRYCTNSLTIDPTGLAEQEVGEITGMAFVTSADKIPKLNLDPAITFENRQNVIFNLNAPGPIHNGNKREIHNVHWVIFRGKNMDDVEIKRYRTGTFTYNEFPVDEGNTQVPAPVNGKELVTPDLEYLDKGRMGGGQWGIANIEWCKLVNQGYIAVADAPGTNRDTIPFELLPIDYKWHFLLVAKSETTGDELARIMYDVHIAGLFVEGQFRDLKGEQNGVNEATLKLWWVKNKKKVVFP